MFYLYLHQTFAIYYKIGQCSPFSSRQKSIQTGAGGIQHTVTFGTDVLIPRKIRRFGFGDTLTLTEAFKKLAKTFGDGVFFTSDILKKKSIKTAGFQSTSQSLTFGTDVFKREPIRRISNTITISEAVSTMKKMHRTVADAIKTIIPI